MPTLLKQLLTRVTMESDEAVVPVIPAEGEQPAEDADPSLADQVVAEVTEIDAAVEEHDKATESVQALESLALALESTIQSGRGYTALEMALHDTAVAAHYKLIGLARPQAPAMESFATPESSLTASQLALESLGETLKKAGKALWEFIKGLLAKARAICKKIFGRMKAVYLRLKGKVNPALKKLKESGAQDKKEKTYKTAALSAANCKDYIKVLKALGELVELFGEAKEHSALRMMLLVVDAAASAIKGNREFDERDILVNVVPDRLSSELPGKPSITWNNSTAVWSADLKSEEVPYPTVSDAEWVGIFLENMWPSIDAWDRRADDVFSHLESNLSKMAELIDKEGSTSKLDREMLAKLRAYITSNIRMNTVVLHYVQIIFVDYEGWIRTLLGHSEATT